MVTRQQAKNIASRIDALAAAIDPHAGAVRVVVFDGETPDLAMRRHVELRPEHAGRKVAIEQEAHERTEARELCAVFAGATPEDYRRFKAFIDRLPRTWVMPNAGRFEDDRPGNRNFLEFNDEL